MTEKETLLGFEIAQPERGIAGGAEVWIPLRHTAVTGQTQESGKTTTLEAIITRSGLRAIAFITKRGEKSFRLMTPVPVYFREPEDLPETPLWRWVESIFETVGTSISRDDRALVIRASEEILRVENYKVKREPRQRTVSTGERVTSLEEVAANVRLMLRHARGRDAKSLTCLDAYFKIVIPQVRRLKSSPQLALAPGVNVMDLEGLTEEMQMLVIRSVIDEVYRHRKNTVVIVPEAHKFISRVRSSPVRLAAELLIREGLVLRNVLMIDSQDLAAVATEVLKSIGVWILGKQTEINEVRRTVNLIPERPKVAETDIMQLGKGEFYVIAESVVRKVYVQPAGMTPEHARAIATGEESADSWKSIVRSLDRHDQMDAPAGTYTPMPEIDETDNEISEASGRDPNEEFRDQPLPPQLLQIQEQTDDDGSEAGDSDQPELAESGIDRSLDALSPAEPGGDVQLDGDGVRNLQSPGSGEAADAERSGESEAPMVRNETPAECITRLERIIRKLEDALIARGIPLPNILETSPHLPDAAAVAPLPPYARIAKAHDEAGAPPFNLEVKAVSLEGNFAEFLRRLREHPEVIHLVAQQPIIRVKIERPVLDLDSSTIAGKIAMMYTQGFFAQPQNGPAVARELKRRGCATPTTNVYKPLDKMAAMGFLTVEASGYQAVPGMKIETVKA